MATANSGDLKLQWDIGLAEGDLVFNTTSSDLDMDGGLVTAVLISLFTDKRADVSDILPDGPSKDQSNRRGWWGDLASPEFPGDQIGSKLWLLERAKLTVPTLALAIEYAEEALEWMIEDGLASDIIVTAERQVTPIKETLAMQVTVKKYDGTDIALNFDDLWEVTINAL